MSAVDIPCGIYNNPSRLGVQVMPETSKKLSDAHSNFVVDKEALPSVEQLVQVQRLCQGKVKIMCCDFPKYSIVLPTLAVGGTARPISAETLSPRRRLCTPVPGRT